MDRRPLEAESLPAQTCAAETSTAETLSAEQTLSSENQALIAQNQRLTRQVETLEEFCHTLSHEMKTPLTSAREFICLIAEGVAGPLTIEQIEYLTICRNSCDQLHRVVNDLVDLSRIETGKFSIQPREFTTEFLVRDLATAARLRAERAGLSLTVEFEGDCASQPIEADLDRAKQVLGNLIDNALKFTPEGGTIEVSARVAEKGDRVIFSVRDTGSGIAPEEHEKIFDRHYQATRSAGHGAGEPGAVGLGLGLNLCKELVELHGGRIWLESIVGAGSEFCFTLPTARSEISPKEPQGGRSPRRSSLSMTTLRSRKASASG